MLSPVWIPILTFSVYAGLAERSGDEFGLAKVFTSFSILVLLNGPLQSLMHALPSIAGGITSFQRIQNYVNAQKRVDKRVVFGTMSEKSDSTRWTKSAETINTEGDHSSGSTVASEKTMPSAQFVEHHCNRIASVSGKFTWPGTEEAVLNIDHWCIHRHQFHCLLGPLGCGKSTLLKALLGELSEFDGTVSIAASRVAYCAQSPWIPNLSIREVILHDAPLDPVWYRTVLHACALTPDLAVWPRGDRTMTGSRGISLSGGQKTRLVSIPAPGLMTVWVNIS
jgi:ABC-type multidrug transport system fused ATPase/permease subunit